MAATKMVVGLVWVAGMASSYRRAGMGVGESVIRNQRCKNVGQMIVETC